MRRKSQYPSIQHPGYVRGICERMLGALDDSAAPVRPFIDVPAVRALTDRLSADATEGWAVRPLEQLLQINDWLESYHVRVR